MNSKINFVLAAAFFFTSGTGLVLAANDMPASSTGKKVGAPAPASTQLTAGEVRKVDIEQGKLTIKHEALPNLDMPGMTMVFKVLDENLLKEVTQGDEIMFRAEKLDVGFTVVELEQTR